MTIRIEPLTISAANPQLSLSPEKGFKDALQKTFQPLAKISPETSTKQVMPKWSDIEAVEKGMKKMVASVQPQFKNLFEAQLTVQNYSLQIELISKAAESASSTAKRLQQG